MDFENAAALAQEGTTALDLSAVGDGAQGSVTVASDFSEGQVFLSSGRLAEFIFMVSAGLDQPRRRHERRAGRRQQDRRGRAR